MTECGIGGGVGGWGAGGGGGVHVPAGRGGAGDRQQRRDVPHGPIQCCQWATDALPGVAGHPGQTLTIHHWLLTIDHWIGSKDWETSWLRTQAVASLQPSSPPVPSSPTVVVKGFRV